ncbi:MAG: right-handed parallel beta-helix repeat-containing protein, partial [Saprospiraceae bacterium]
RVCVTDSDNNTHCSNINEFTTAPATATPTCNLSINGGSSTTNSMIVSLDVAATTPQGNIALMRFSNNGINWSNYYNYTPVFGSWGLASYGGNPVIGQSSTVYVEVKDNSGNTSQCSASISISTGTPGFFWVRDKKFSSLRLANEYAVAGDTIYATAGYFDLSSEVDNSQYSPSNNVGVGLKDGVSLVGAGHDKTTLFWNYAYASLVLNNNNFVAGLTLLGSSNYSGSSRIIWVNGNNSTIAYCKIKNGDNPIEFYYSNGVTYSNNTFRNNIFSNHDGGIHLRYCDSTLFVNNILYLIDGVPFYVTSQASNTTVSNNIFYQNNFGGISLSSSSLGLTYTNNCLNQTYNGDHNTSNGNITANPMFVNPSLDDFGLQNNSPCINSGTSVMIPYAGTAPEMGAYEYQATGSINLSSNIAGTNVSSIKPDGTTSN